MSNYAEEDNWNSTDSNRIGLKPIKKYGTKVKNTADKVIEKPDVISKYELVAWANIDISPMCIKKSLALSPEENISTEDRLQISELYFIARETEDVIRQIAYAALIGVRPLISNEIHIEMIQ
jgi:hypothetical protein